MISLFDVLLTVVVDVVVDVIIIVVVAMVACPKIVEEFDNCVNAKPAPRVDDAEKAYGNMVKCLDLFKLESAGYMSKK